MQNDSSSPTPSTQNSSSQKKRGVSRWLGFVSVKALTFASLVAACGGGSSGTDGSSSSTDSPSAGGTKGSLGGAGGGASSGGKTGTGGTTTTGGADSGGATGSAPSGGNAGAAGAGADTGTGGGPALGCEFPPGPGPTTVFDYYFDGATIHWVSGDSSGSVATLVSPPQDNFLFAEGELGVNNLITSRRASALFLQGGSFYRLDSKVDGPVPHALQRVSSLSGVSDVCHAWVASNLADRAQSQLIFQYVSEGSCASESASESLSTARIFLEDCPDTEAEVLDPRVRPLIGPAGTIVDVLRRSEDGRLTRVQSLTNTSELDELLPAVPSVGGVEVEASLDASRFLLSVARNTGIELYVYDAQAHSLSAPLGLFDNFTIPTTGIVRTGTHGFFVGIHSDGLTDYQIYRFPLDGSALPEPYGKLSTTNPFSLSVLGIAGGKLIYRQMFPLTAGIFSVPVGADFGTPPTATTIVNSNVVPRFLSETRLFYQNGNRAGAVNLDGSNSELWSVNDVSLWLGCTRNPNFDFPLSLELGRNCERVYLVGYGVTSYQGKLNSYSADADPGDVFFASMNRDTKFHGQLPDEFSTQPLLVDGTKNGFNPYPVWSQDLVAGVIQLEPGLAGPFRSALFSMPAPRLGGPSPLTMIAPPGKNLVWLSRGP